MPAVSERRREGDQYALGEELDGVWRVPEGELMPTIHFESDDDTMEPFDVEIDDETFDALKAYAEQHAITLERALKRVIDNFLAKELA